MPAYPSGALPPPMAEGFMLKPREHFSRTPMESGAARHRRLFSAHPTRITAAWRFSRHQLGIFESWHRNTIADGSAWFDVDLPNGQGVNTVSAKFVSQPSKKLLDAMRWTVTAELEVIALDVYTSGELEALDETLTDPVWPGAWLPNPRVTDYELTDDEIVARTDMTEGKSQERRRSQDIPSLARLSWRMTGSELGIFEGWYRHAINDGGSWFDVDLPNGLELNTVRARFSKPIEKALQPGLKWLVSGQLEISGLPVMSAEHLELLLAYPYQDVLDGAGPLHHLLHVSMPVHFNGYAIE